MPRAGEARNINNTTRTSVNRNVNVNRSVDVDVDAVLDRLLLGDDLEPDPRTVTTGVLDPVVAEVQVFVGQTDRPIEVVPRVETGRRRRDHVVQRLRPEQRQRLR